jgi:hypothetical protein
MRETYSPLFFYPRTDLTLSYFPLLLYPLSLFFILIFIFLPLSPQIHFSSNPLSTLLIPPSTLLSYFLLLCRDILLLFSTLTSVLFTGG